MKPLMIKIVIGAAGFGGGFLAGFFCHKKMNDVKFEEVSEADMAEIEKRVKEAQEKALKEAAKETPKESKKEDILEKNIEDLPTDPDELKKALQGKKSYIQADAEQKMAYDKLWKATNEYSSEENANQIPVEPPEEEEEFDEDFLRQIQEEAEAKENSFEEPPKQIDLATFYNEYPSYDEVTIHYWEPDKQWRDEQEEVIEDIESYIGEEIRDPFAANPFGDDADTRFWLNHHYQTKYELLRHHRSFSER